MYRNKADINMFRIMILSVLPGLVLIIQNGIWLNTSSELLNDKLGLRKNVMFTLEVSDVLHRTQIERGLTSLYVASDRTNDDNEIDDLLQDAYRQTSEALEDLTGWLYTDTPAYFKTKNDYILHLDEFRYHVLDYTVEEVVGFYSDDNAIFIEWMVDVIERHTDIWAEFVAFHLLINGKECVGIERAIGVIYYTTGKLSDDTLLWYQARHERADSYLEQFRIHSQAGARFLDLYIDKAIAESAENMRHQIILNETHASSEQSGMDWINNMTAYINALDEVFRAMAGYLTEKVDDDIREHRLELVTDIVIVLLTVVMVPLLNFFIYKITKKMEAISKKLQEKTVNLETEQKRTESLLCQLIPAKIAKRMNKSSVLPEYIDHVTVMYSDIYDFASLMGSCNPNEMIRLVNDIFEILDKRIGVHNVSKVGSIGNVLMVGSGLHQKHTDIHAVDIATLALDFVERIRQLDVPNIEGEKIRLRIGINTGPVVTGIVQGTFPRFCVYGTTPTNAQLMMMTCLPGHIQITACTRTALERHRQFIIRDRGDVVKQMACCYQEETYWLMESPISVVNLETDWQQNMEIRV